MEREPRPFEITVGDMPLVLEMGKCAVALFRHQQEVSYIAVDVDKEDIDTIRIFNNSELAYWMAGYYLKHQDGNLYRTPNRRAGQTFRELYGWNPAIVERERPNVTELETWTDLNTGDLEDGLKGLLNE